jgi:hypothetical protein
MNLKTGGEKNDEKELAISTNGGRLGGAYYPDGLRCHGSAS